MSATAERYLLGALTAAQKIRARDLLTTNMCGHPVAYKVLKRNPTPGRWEPEGYLLIGTTGYVDVDLDFMPRSVGMLYPLTSTAPEDG